MSPAVLAGLAVEVTAAYLVHNHVPAAAVPRVLESVAGQLAALAPPAPAPGAPAVESRRRSPSSAAAPTGEAA